MFNTFARQAQQQFFKTAQRSFHERAPQRKWVQQYDQEVVRKYPRVLQVIQGTIPKAELNTTERSAYFVSTYRTGLSGAKRIRKTERRLNFEAKVNALVGSWKEAESLKRKEDVRKGAMSKKTPIRLSTYKDTVNLTKLDVKTTMLKPFESEKSRGVGLTR